MNKELILVLGGARGGKSTYAEELAQELGGDDVVFIATAQALDEEMASRIVKHQATRPAAWRTVEAPSLVGVAPEVSALGARVVLLDCLTLLASNALLAADGASNETARTGSDPGMEPTPNAEAEAKVEEETAALLDAYARGSATWIVVSNEVGLGLVPDNPLGRSYRDALGRANQSVAAAADRVVFLIAGLPMRLK